MSRSTIGLDAENPEAVGNRPKKRNAGFIEKVEQDMSCSTNYKREDIGQPFMPRNSLRAAYKAAQMKGA